MMLTMSAGFLRFAFDTAFATDFTGSSTRTWRAWSPLRPCTSPNSTRVPGFSVATPAGRAAGRTETSPPSSFDRKPKPRSASYHFTLPVGTGGPFFQQHVPEDRRSVDGKPTGRRSPIPLRFGELFVHRAGPEPAGVDRHLGEAGCDHRVPDRTQGQHLLDPVGVHLQAGPVTEVADAQVAHRHPGVRERRPHR